MFLERICREAKAGNPVMGIEPDPNFPGSETVRLWALKDTELFLEYAQARDFGLEAMLERTADIADDGSNDYIPTDKGWQFDREHVQRSKLRVENAHRLAATFNQKRFGKKVELSSDPDNPLVPKRAAQDYTQEELLAILAAARARRKAAGGGE